MENFDPNGVGVNNGNIFALPFNEENAELILIPAPWDVTVSYGAGTHEGPEQIIEASNQIDFHNHLYPQFYERGIYSLPINPDWLSQSRELRSLSESYINDLENGIDKDSHAEILEKVNNGCSRFLEELKHKALFQLEQGKKVAMIGGDHSTSLAMLKAFSNEYESFGVLQIDAHADLRDAYEGFTYSHASVMYNALEIKEISKLVQVGIRDLCQAEKDLIDEHPDRIKTYYDQGLQHALFGGKTWKSICIDIIESLPEFVYISFDIDGLNPNLCPNTGTPVPGGLEFEQACYLIEQLSLSGKKIIGFDVVEVCNGSEGDWDANVGMRLIYRIAAAMFKSRK